MSLKTLVPAYYCAVVGESKCYDLNDEMLIQKKQEHTTSLDIVTRGSTFIDNTNLSWYCCTIETCFMLCQRRMSCMNVTSSLAPV